MSTRDLAIAASGAAVAARKLVTHKLESVGSVMLLRAEDPRSLSGDGYLTYAEQAAMEARAASLEADQLGGQLDALMHHARDQRTPTCVPGHEHPSNQTNDPENPGGVQ